MDNTQLTGADNLVPGVDFGVGATVTLGPDGTVTGGTVTGGVGSPGNCPTCNQSKAINSTNLPFIVLGIAVIVLVMRR